MNKANRKLKRLNRRIERLRTLRLCASAVSEYFSHKIADAYYERAEIAREQRDDRENR